MNIRNIWLTVRKAFYRLFNKDELSEMDFCLTLEVEVYGGDVEKVKLLLDGGANVNARDEYGTTVLILAAHEGHEDTVKLLLDRGADVNAQNASGQTALMEAANGGKDAGIVKLLLDRGADVNVRDNFGRTALNWIAEGGKDAGIVKLLLDRGADVNARNKYGTTALMKAAQEGHEDTVKLLLDRGADVNVREVYGKARTALNAAEERGYSERDYSAIVILLQRAGAVRGRDLDLNFKHAAPPPVNIAEELSDIRKVGGGTPADEGTTRSGRDGK